MVMGSAALSSGLGQKRHREWPGLDAPTMNSGGPVTGDDQERHRIENRRRHNENLEQQVPTDYWRRYRVQHPNA
ncbi:LOW QUALITY PROTEIN: hypothetical protein ACHAWF_012847 [Thalassiosira exigua]